MRPPTDLQRLMHIADLVAQTALSELADAEQEVRQLETEIARINQRRLDCLDQNQTPQNAQLVLKYSRFQLKRRKECLTRLSILEASRRQKFRLAQRAEGRRQALRKLIDQAS